MSAGPRRGAVVTGAARGIGLAIARRLAHDGLDVVLLDRSEPVRGVAADLAAELAAERAAERAADRAAGMPEGIGITAAVVDLTDVDAPAELAAVADQHRIDVVVNNAGIFDKTPILDLDPAEWSRMQQVNTATMLLTMQAFVPGMIERGRGGRVVNMASMAAKLGTPGESAYAASKAAVVALSRIAAMEFGPHDITVNSICPGYVLTEMGADTRTEEQIREWSAKSPLDRLASTDDVAALVSHLVSDEAAYITGEALNVTGGMCTW